MGKFKGRLFTIPMGIVVGVIVTGMLFIALPMLTSFQRQFKEKQEAKMVLISQTRPPPPPPADRDKPQRKKAPKKVKQVQQKRKVTARPKIETPRLGLTGGNIAGTIQISGLEPQDFKIDTSPFATAFSLTEVDQPPRVLRAFSPQYPFLAKRKNIEGRVLVKFVVDKDGNILSPQIYRAEPEGQGFEEQALKAIKRYKIKPAIKDGEPVACIAIQPITFVLR